MLQEEAAEYEVGEEEEEGEGGAGTGPPGDAEQGVDLPLPEADFDMHSASFRSLPVVVLEQPSDEQQQTQEKEGHQAVGASALPDRCHAASFGSSMPFRTPRAPPPAASRASHLPLRRHHVCVPLPLHVRCRRRPR